MKKLLLPMVVLCLVSCNRFLLRTTDTNYLSSSNDFNDILTLKYLRYSDALYSYSDYRSAEHFAKLAIQSDKRKNEISFNVDTNMLKQDPNALADLYFLFNCWMYFETNNKNLGEASICKDSFNKIILIAEKKRVESLSDKIFNNDGDKQKFLTREEEINFLNIAKNNSLDIQFDYDSYKLNPQAIAKINALLKYVNSLKNDYKITIIGHADRAGKVIYNNTLARRRAITVYNILNKNGVPKTLLSIEGVSSKSPNIITKTNDKMQSNRRVEIVVDSDYRSQDITPQPYF
jgi:outer membrane protein OmpA-like peptidoglycan-associated protein